MEEELNAGHWVELAKDMHCWASIGDRMLARNARSSGTLMTGLLLVSSIFMMQQTLLELFWRSSSTLRHDEKHLTHPRLSVPQCDEQSLTTLDRVPRYHDSIERHMPKPGTPKVTARRSEGVVLLQVGKISNERQRT
ncbi:MAG: hypothetical protein LQ344_006085 [Seirophora lacunosa]|nr:MAG: hypothetical protein LQ344_006085 [Seirophora lacunosa]